MSAFDDMRKSEALAKAERRMSEALGMSRPGALSGAARLDSQIEAPSRAIAESIGTGGFGAPRGPRATDMLGATVADALGSGLGGLGVRAGSGRATSSARPSPMLSA